MSRLPKVHNFLSEDEWKAFREDKITATDVAAILGVHPYKTAAEVVDGWAHSHGHCVNIMGDFEELGVAYVETQDQKNNYYWTQVFGVPFK